MGVFFVLNSCAAGYVDSEPATVETYRAPQPYTDYIWIEGNWVWSNNAYEYQQGYWAKPRPGRVYVQGYWSHEPRGHRWVKGRWK